MNARPHLAWTSYEWAEPLTRRDAEGDRGRATDLLEEARVLAEELGLTGLVTKIDLLRKVVLSN